MARRGGAACLAALLVAGCAPAAEACRPMLVLQGHPDGERLAEIATGPEAGAFSLSYTHSVSLTQVVSRYRIERGRILQVAEEFDQHGAGLPFGQAEPGSRFEHKDGRFILHLRREIPELLVRVAAEHGNRLAASRTIDLAKWGDRRVKIAPGGCGAEDK